jgi:hypothetical protein
MRRERSRFLESSKPRRILAIRCGVVLVALLASCQAPVPNPKRVDLEPRAPAPTVVADAEPIEPQPETFASAPEPFLLAEHAGTAWVQPITFDPTGAWPGASSSSALRSPLWPMRASGDVGVPRGLSRAEQENVAVGAVVGAGLFAAALLHAFGVWR